jgi:hypothetical protein
VDAAFGAGFATGATTVWLSCLLGLGLLGALRDGLLLDLLEVADTLPLFDGACFAFCWGLDLADWAALDAKDGDLEVEADASTCGVEGLFCLGGADF